MEVEQIMLTDKEFLAFLNDKSLNGYSEKMLSDIINEEMQKPEEEMDTELIEYCLDALNKIEGKTSNIEDKKKGKGDSNGKHIKYKFKKAVAIAVAAVMLIVGAVSVSALVFNLNPFDGMLEFYEDYIHIRFDNNDNKASDYKLLSSELAEDLAKNGISPVLIPEALLSDNCEILSVEYEKTDAVITANVSFKYRGSNGYICISSCETIDFLPPTDYLDTDNRVESITVSGIAIFILEQNSKGTIAYQDNLTEYLIVTEMSFEDAIEFAKTIK